MSLGTRINRLRTERKLSQGELAEALGVSRQSISKWNTGSSVPELDKLMKLSRLFGLTLDELVTGEAAEKVESPASQTPAAGSDGPREAVAGDRDRGVCMYLSPMHTAAGSNQLGRGTGCDGSYPAGCTDSAAADVERKTRDVKKLPCTTRFFWCIQSLRRKSG